MATLTPGSNLANKVAHSGPSVQGVPRSKSRKELGGGFLLMPTKIIGDRKNGSRLRVLACLINRGMRSNNPVAVTQETLVQELELARSTIQTTIHDLARSGYLEVLLDPVNGGHSYRLTPSPEGGK